jgi:hypothetical protein
LTRHPASHAPRAPAAAPRQMLGRRGVVVAVLATGVARLAPAGATSTTAWLARVRPCSSTGAQNQSWAFTLQGQLQSAATATTAAAAAGPGRCVDSSQRSGCGNTCGRALLTGCAGAGGNATPAAQRWSLAPPPSRLLTGGGGAGSAGGCLLIRENPHIDPGVLYHASPCKNTSNEQWDYDAASQQLRLLCTSGTCLPWHGYCLTADSSPLPPPPLPPAPPAPTPPVPLAPLLATELYRTRVHTAGHYCCPGGRPYCNATAAMRAARCSGSTITGPLSCCSARTAPCSPSTRGRGCGTRTTTTGST